MSSQKIQRRKQIPHQVIQTLIRWWPVTIPTFEFGSEITIPKKNRAGRCAKLIKEQHQKSVASCALGGNPPSSMPEYAGDAVTGRLVRWA